MLRWYFHVIESLCRYMWSCVRKSGAYTALSKLIIPPVWWPDVSLFAIWNTIWAQCSIDLVFYLVNMACHSGLVLGQLDSNSVVLVLSVLCKSRHFHIGQSFSETVLSSRLTHCEHFCFFAGEVMLSDGLGTTSCSSSSHLPTGPLGFLNFVFECLLRHIWLLHFCMLSCLVMF